MPPPHHRGGPSPRFWAPANTRVPSVLTPVGLALPPLPLTPHSGPLPSGTAGAVLVCLAEGPLERPFPCLGGAGLVAHFPPTLHDFRYSHRGHLGSPCNCWLRASGRTPILGGIPASGAPWDWGRGGVGAQEAPGYPWGRMLGTGNAVALAGRPECPCHPPPAVTQDHWPWALGTEASCFGTCCPGPLGGRRRARDSWSWGWGREGGAAPGSQPVL